MKWLFFSLFWLFSLIFGSQGHQSNPALEEHLRRTLLDSYPGVDFSVEVIWMPTPLKSAVARNIQSVEFRHTQMPRANTTAIITIDDTAYPVQLFVKTHQKAFVAKELIREGEEISIQNISPLLLETTHVAQLPANELQIQHVTASRFIGKGEVIVESALKKPVDFPAGHRFSMTSNIGGIEVAMECEARSAGYVGEGITLKCRQTGKRYQAIIIDLQTAKWKKTL